MKKTQLLNLIILITALLFGACKKDADLNNKNAVLTVATTSPSGLENAKINSGTITLKELNSGQTITSEDLLNGGFQLTLNEGSYDISFEGTIEFTENGVKKTSKVKGYKEGVVISGGDATANISLFLSNANENFVIKEIFLTGTVTPEGKQYNGDKYFIIYNNSADTLYADGLVIAQSAFLTTTKRAYTPDLMTSDFTASEVVMIPGSGKQYPIKPGASFVVANNAINHLEYNKNSIDLRTAEFEMELLPSINVDNPQVTNLINVSGTMTMHNRGFKSFVIARIKGSANEFKEANYYTYGYTNVLGNITNANGYKIANNDIVDAVNLSVADSFEWIVTDPSLDMGWTHCGTTDSDANRYGKSVIRKVLPTAPGGRQILKDTNNSTEDFTAEAVPSLKK